MRPSIILGLTKEWLDPIYRGVAGYPRIGGRRVSLCRDFYERLYKGIAPQGAWPPPKTKSYKLEAVITIIHYLLHSAAYEAIVKSALRLQIGSVMPMLLAFR